MSRFLKILALLLAVGIFAGCGKQYSDTAAPASTESTESTEVMEKEGEETAEVMEKEADYTLDLASFSFTPNTIEAKPGETITVLLKNTQGFHDFVIDELDVKSPRFNAPDEEMVTINIPADAAGKTFAFYCSVGTHRDQGMEGTLVVK